MLQLYQVSINHESGNTQLIADWYILDAFQSCRIFVDAKPNEILDGI